MLLRFGRSAAMGAAAGAASTHYLILSPGERFDVVIDFTEMQGQNFAMTNDAPAPYARGGEIVPSDVMLFKVTKPLAGKDTSALPERFVADGSRSIRRTRCGNEFWG